MREGSGVGPPSLFFFTIPGPNSYHIAFSKPVTECVNYINSVYFSFP